MNEMVPESTRCVTGSAVNMGGGKRLLLSEGWRDYSRTRWSYRSVDGLPVTLLGKFTDKNLLPPSESRCRLFSRQGLYCVPFQIDSITVEEKTFL